jgi:hypothetical protein
MTTLLCASPSTAVLWLLPTVAADGCASLLARTLLCSVLLLLSAVRGWELWLAELRTVLTV